MKTLRIGRIRPWMTLGLAAIMLAGVCGARPALADDLPHLAGREISLTFKAQQGSQASLLVASQSPAGSFNGTLQQGNVSTPVSGTITPAATGGYAISFHELSGGLFAQWFEGSVWDAGGEIFMAGSMGRAFSGRWPFTGLWLMPPA
jgi:hypothetical protein